MFRDSKQKANYDFFEKPEKISFILCSSIPGPKYEKTGKGAKLDAKDDALLRKKLCKVFDVALEKGHDSVVSTTFDKSPPECMANIFKELLLGPYANRFEDITFTCQEDENCGIERGHLRAFQQEFLTVPSKSKEKCSTM